MTKIFIVNGYPGSGKTTFENLCVLNYNKDKGKVRVLSSIDIVKKIAKSCGYKGEKTPESRKFLSEFKRILTEYNDLPYRSVIKEVRNFIKENLETDNIIFIDCREKDQIDRFVKSLHAKTLLIKRNEVKNDFFSNPSDALVMDYKYDITILNNAGLNDLEKSALTFLNMVWED